MTIFSSLQVMFPTTPFTRKRYGNKSDGGYVLVESPALNIDCIYTFGVGKETSFENAYIADHPVPVHMYDPTIDALPTPNDLYTFHKEGISLGTTLATYLATNSTLSNNILLKMDVEGAEWSFLKDELNPELAARIPCIVAELHFTRGIPTPVVLAGLASLSALYVPVHVHANTEGKPVTILGESLWSDIEITFLRRDLTTFAPNTSTNFPLPMDYPNDGTLINSTILSGYPWRTKTERSYKVNLYIAPYTSESQARNDENQACLSENARSLYIDNIYPLQPQETRPTYNDFFAAISQFSGPNDVNIIANTDITFDQTLEWLARMTLNDAFILTRWEVPRIGVPYFLNKADSSDVWVIRGLPKVNIMGDLQLGQLGCDCRIAFELKKAGYRVRNFGKVIRSFHHHVSKYRTWKVADQYPESDGYYMPPIEQSLLPLENKVISTLVSTPEEIPNIPTLSGWTTRIYTMLEPALFSQPVVHGDDNNAILLDTSVDRFICRAPAAPIYEKAVAEWIASGATLHSIRASATDSSIITPNNWGATRPVIQAANDNPPLPLTDKSVYPLGSSSFLMHLAPDAPPFKGRTKRLEN